MNLKLITIDGPAGCGKSTVGQGVADALDGLAFNTGLIYRAVTWLALEAGADLESPEAILELLETRELTLQDSRGGFRVLLDGSPVGDDELKTPRVTREIHWVADSREVRSRLLPLQRELPTSRVVVAEGRDLGTVVFPDAPLKIFLTATAEERALRRHREWESRQGERLSYEEVLEDVRRRDRFDQDREVAPLRAADDARTVDTTVMTADEAVAAILALVPEGWFPA